MRVDLHSHTTISDGLSTPAALVEAAARAGVDVLAVTDHDTTEGIPAALAEAERHGLRLIPGMEVSSHHQNKGIHILAYFGPSALPKVADWQSTRRRERRARLVRILERLEGLGITLDHDRVFETTDTRRSPGRPHIARALLEAGHVESMQDAFDRYLGREGAAFVDDSGPEAAQAIAMIHELPGLAVVAHPGYDSVDPWLEDLARLGLDGVEAYHGNQDEEVSTHFHRRARDLNLLVTGGSDFHGDVADPGKREAGGRLGQVRLPDEEWRRFDAALQQRTTGGE